MGEVVPFEALKTANGISFVMPDSGMYQKNYLESFSIEKVVGDQRIVFWSIEKTYSPHFHYAEFTFPLKYGEDLLETKVIVPAKKLEYGTYKIDGLFLFQGYKEPNDRPAYWDKVFAGGTFNVE